ncbi:tRNA (guanine(10)-N(2))-dimethyltransferase [Methanococcus voltae]|uniref:tRNA (guanine(26)-N(2))-dimethyltransferase n=2 Tax=Methanococcus voltae TaxID=2188 RepID=A0A8J7RHZ2_METVO|nr:tRNA (guanine(10)-N(2))-dimethyltransferase [Methanococcus voltae]MBP2172770.1 tRNA (guanine26-N2/guanine27-N2)-dimethyltransferase [Methanococcus voltae]MBP2201820.1 tRNA (guanine26-N2/guanine27-N2)-dimethyltransferase [Methanococcus voltae]MCS3922644.1 tRNA (guanine26-N2/guanine27-N2)-dimethyltransferase [Methanococcus voltae PS]
MAKKTIIEGNTNLNISEERTLSKKDPVFYNPIMEVNRDISISTIQAFLNNFKRDEFKICDALGGSGARGLRYAKELDFKGILDISIGDINPNAIRAIHENIKLNEFDDNVKLSVHHKDANILLSENYREFNVTDLDPFGSPAPYMDSGIRATLTKGGILCMTATDTAVLCGAYHKSCIRRYNSVPIRGDKEYAVRILIASAILNSAKYDIGLRPLFSHCTDHYVRTFMITERGAGKAEKAMENLGYVKRQYEDITTKNYFDGFERGFGGPFYMGKLNDEDLVNDAHKIAEERNYSNRAVEILNTLKEESKFDMVGSYNIHEICSFIKKLVPPMDVIIQDLTDKGFKVSRVHYTPYALKSDAKLADIIVSISENSSI